MTKYILFLTLLLAVSGEHSFGQANYPISSYNTTARAFRNLLLTNQQIEDNDTINEEILDLVTPMVQDSVIGRKKEHHQVFLVGWFIHAFGNYNWRAMNPVKEKIVGTIKRASRSSEEEFTEYDINFDLYMHLHKYLWHTFPSYDLSGKTRRENFGHKGKKNWNEEPYVRDTMHIDMNKYRMHCELTPPKAFRPQLHYLFYPTQPGTDIEQHPNFMSRFPSMGFYGVNCLDCNHTCHAEIHPYDWIWWMNLHNGTGAEKTWLVGLMKDGSNRFRHWTHNPKTGKISIPFSFHIDGKVNKGRSVTVEHLVFDRFLDAEMTKLTLPTDLISPNREYMLVNFSGASAGDIPVTLHFKSAIVTNGLKYWFSDVNWDEQNHILSGFFNMATSVHDVYTMKVTFAQE
ncbi:MAG: hypothetical protein JWO03_2415 [Bacteroidetes bacterium]|nr:hypothetical protein [Bacteroidota bacterium]